MKAFYDKDFTLGIIGGGQLGRMLIQSGIDINVNMSVMDGDPNAPCRSLIDNFFVGSLLDKHSVVNFGKNCDVITYEIEHINVEGLYELEQMGKKVFPKARILEIVQDKGLQKQFYIDNDIPTSPFTTYANQEEIKEKIAAGAIQFPIVHKVRTGGYDGNGVKILKKAADLEDSFSAPSLLEDMVNFEKEIAVIVSRNEQGQVKTFPAVEMVFHPVQNLVEYLFSPADINSTIAEKADHIATDLADKLDLVGILAVEMFVTKDGEVLVNEIAPRPHNSGHQTIEGNWTSQYAQHLRSILNLPLGNTETIIPSAMVNILGEEGFSGDARLEGIEDTLTKEGVYVHMYGKKITRPFRKMGHVIILDKDKDQLLEKVKFVQKTLKVKS